MIGGGTRSQHLILFGDSLPPAADSSGNAGLMCGRGPRRLRDWRPAIPPRAECHVPGPLPRCRCHPLWVTVEARPAAGPRRESLLGLWLSEVESCGGQPGSTSTALDFGQPQAKQRFASRSRRRASLDRHTQRMASAPGQRARDAALSPRRDGRTPVTQPSRTAAAHQDRRSHEPASPPAAMNLRTRSSVQNVSRPRSPLISATRDSQKTADSRSGQP